MPLTCCLSGPERTRAQAELALETARIPIVPDGHYSLMGWETKLQLDDKHALLNIQVRDAEQLNQAVTVVEKAKWVLRVHHDTLPEPEPTAEQTLAATVEEMRAEIAALKAKVGLSDGR